MCTYVTQYAPVDGSGKGPQGWFTVRQATVYVDHPQHAPYGHTVNIDFGNPQLGPAARVAVELTEESALALIEAIRGALASAPAGIASATVERLPGAAPTSSATVERLPGAAPTSSATA